MEKSIAMETLLDKYKNSSLSQEDFLLLLILYDEYLYNKKINRVLELFNPENTEKFIDLKKDGTFKIKEDYIKLITSDDNTDIVEIVNFLNEKTGKRYSAKSVSTKRLIRSRLRDGYSKDDLKGVIETMANQWMYTKMEYYLRPETLFNETKFQTYYSLYLGSKNKEKDWTIDKA